MLDRLFGIVAILTLPLTLIGAANSSITGSSIDWHAPAFATLEVGLRACRAPAADPEWCARYSADMQHAYDAAVYCFSRPVDIAACEPIKKRLVRDGDAFFRAIEYVYIQPFRTAGLRGSNPWIAEAMIYCPSGLLQPNPVSTFGWISFGSMLLAWLARFVRLRNLRVAEADLRERVNAMKTIHSDVRARYEQADQTVKLFQGLTSSIDLALGSPVKATCEPLQAEDPTSSLDVVFGQASARRIQIDRKSREASSALELWNDRTIRGRHGRSAGIFYFEIPRVPVVLEVKVSRDSSVRPGGPMTFHVRCWARFSSWDGLQERHACKWTHDEPLEWRHYISLVCDRQEAEPAAIAASKVWMMSALRREIEVTEGTFTTQRYERAVDDRKWYGERQIETANRLFGAINQLSALRSR